MPKRAAVAAVAVDVKLIDGINHMGIVSRAEGGVRDRRRRCHARHGGVIATMREEGDMIDSQQASEALADINDIVRRVRQSRIYNLASLMLIMWGALVFAGYLGRYLSAALCRLCLDRGLCRRARGFVRDQRLRPSRVRRPHLRSQDAGRRSCCSLLSASSAPAGSAISRRASWARSGRSISCWSTPSPGCGSATAFVAIGLGIIALTLIGYFFIGDWFDLWMAVVNGGGLILGGLWMRRS